MIVAGVLPAAGTINRKVDDKSILFNTQSNKIVNPCSVPNDPDFSKQWYLQTTWQILWVKILLWNIIPIWYPLLVKSDADIDAPEAWNIETGSPDVVIAILDTGVDYTHPDLAANIWNNTDEIPNNSIDDDLNGYIDDVIGWDFANNDNDPIDDFGHGTMNAGVAGAVGNNGIGVAGIAWNCKIMPIRVIDDQGWCASSIIAKGITYAADNGANVISMSFGADDSNNTTIMLEAVNYAYSKGVFLCAAAGNNGDNKLYPAAYENVTAVGWTNQRDKADKNSNYGDWIDIAAPGTLIYSTDTLQDPSLDYAYYGGSSAATAIVAGVTALLLSKDPSLTPAEVKALLCNNTDPYSGNHYVGTGRLNAFKALSALTR